MGWSGRCRWTDRPVLDGEGFEMPVGGWRRLWTTCNLGTEGEAVDDQETFQHRGSVLSTRSHVVSISLLVSPWRYQSHLLLTRDGRIAVTSATSSINHHNSTNRISKASLLSTTAKSHAPISTYLPPSPPFPSPPACLPACLGHCLSLTDCPVAELPPTRADSAAWRERKGPKLVGFPICQSVFLPTYQVQEGRKEGKNAPDLFLVPSSFSPCPPCLPHPPSFVFLPWSSFSFLTASIHPPPNTYLTRIHAYIHTYIQRLLAWASLPFSSVQHSTPTHMNCFHISYSHIIIIILIAILTQPARA
ncbi:hypothetical protein LX32DRAFT_258918 [Colletotrichum zoysiae]|uniref:Uncharacterized protein n=1 Tax=Colletotrichum zoysiae TaxID=1216348 RepID=A0AAD9H2U0_9PEZI|nr:hypothetical protein LX32DRAFT_258918 [Colletotrichum zoysiae]